jgi:hypothetical protein
MRWNDVTRANCNDASLTSGKELGRDLTAELRRQLTTALQISCISHQLLAKHEVLLGVTGGFHGGDAGIPDK